MAKSDFQISKVMIDSDMAKSMLRGKDANRAKNFDFPPLLANYAGVRETIANRGQAVIGGSRTCDGPEFAYTIGNTEHGLPELLAFGPAPALAALLDQVGIVLRNAGKPFEDGTLLVLGGRFPVKIITTDRRSAHDYAVQVADFYRAEPDAVTVQQVLVCDAEGQFPDQDGCAEPHSLQPVLRMH